VCVKQIAFLQAKKQLSGKELEREFSLYPGKFYFLGLG